MVRGGSSHRQFLESIANICPAGSLQMARHGKRHYTAELSEHKMLQILLSLSRHQNTCLQQRWQDVALGLVSILSKIDLEYGSSATKRRAYVKARSHECELDHFLNNSVAVLILVGKLSNNPFQIASFQPRRHL